jgi:hypothetical protein
VDRYRLQGDVCSCLRGSPHLRKKSMFVGARLVARLGLLCALFPACLKGQDVQPRVYTPAPVGVNLLTLAYSYSSGAILFDKTIPIEDADADIHSVAVAFSRSTGVFGMSGRIDLVVPFVTGDWVGDLETFRPSSRHVPDR